MKLKDITLNMDGPDYRFCFIHPDAREMLEKYIRENNIRSISLIENKLLPKNTVILSTAVTTHMNKRREVEIEPAGTERVLDSYRLSWV